MQLDQRGGIASLRSELYIHNSIHCTNHNTVLSFTATTCWHWQSVWLCFLLFQFMKVRQTWKCLSIRMYTVSVGKYTCKYIQPFASFPLLHVGGKSVATLGVGTSLIWTVYKPFPFWQESGHPRLGVIICQKLSVSYVSVWQWPTQCQHCRRNMIRLFTVL